MATRIQTAGVFLLLFVTACAGRADLDRAVDNLADKVTNNLAAGAKPVVAVSDFVGDSGTSAREYVTESFIERLQKSGRVQIVDRQHLKTILDEQKLGAENLVDDDTAARIGHMTGAALMCVGSMSSVADEVQLRVKLLDSTTAVVRAAESGFVSQNAVKAMQPANVAPAAAPEIHFTAEANYSESHTGLIVALVSVGVVVAAAIVGAVIAVNNPPAGRLGVVQF